jgi:hypothetical protein
MIDRLDYVHFLHDLALDGDEGWSVGDVVDLGPFGYDGPERFLVAERDEMLGYWYFEPVQP